MFFICPRGTAQYGDPEDDSKPWSKKWKLEEAEDFLFASGNMKFWLIVSREELIGVDGEKYYDGVITVTASSESETPYKTKGRNRHNRSPDPFVFMRMGYYQPVYIEDSYNHKYTGILKEGGMFVFIRNTIASP